MVSIQTKKIYKKNMKKRTETTVFALINLANTEENQQQMARYASAYARSLDLSLVLYPKNDQTNISFKEGILRIKEITKHLHDVHVHISVKKINIWNFLTSLYHVAEDEHAAHILIGVEDDNVSFLGRAIWDTAEKSLIPITFIPQKLEFKPYGKITIAVDRERKMQKIKMVRDLAAKHGSTINIFVEKTNADNIYPITNALRHVKEHLQKNRIPFTTTHARKSENFPKRICKFSRKHSDLLIIEVEPGKIKTNIKDNVEVLLSIDKFATPVMFTKTKTIGIFQRFH